MFDDRIFIGIGGSVLALRTFDGGEIWRHELKGLLSGMITGVTLVGNRLYASQNGELTCLDPATGAVLWHNSLPGRGTGFISIAGGESAQPGQHASYAAGAAAAAAVSAAVIGATAASS